MRAAQWIIRPFVSVGEQLPVDLYDSEEERRADAEQQHAVHRFQGADHLEPGRQRQSRYFECGHGGQGVDRRFRERVERAEPPICRRPQHALQPVQSGQYQRDGSDVADHGRNRPQQIGRCLSTRARILASRPNAINTTAVVWIAMVSTMSERPRIQLERSTRLPYHRPHRQTATSTEVERAHGPEQRGRLRVHADGYPIGPGAYGRRLRGR